MAKIDTATEVRARAGDAVALTRALVSTPSINPELEEGGGGERAIAELAGSWLADWGYRVDVPEIAPGRFNVVARRGSGPGRLVLNGHLDTVGVSGMSVDPFGAELSGDQLFGRGSCDMKGGLAIILATARAVADELGDGLPGELVVALTGDEEHASLGMQAVVRGGRMADAGVVCEPTSLAVMPAHKGFLWLEARFRGRAAHGSRPEEGVDAIRHGAAFVGALDDYEARLQARDAHPLLGHGTVHAGTITGGSAPSVYPAECRVVLERRTLPGEEPETLAAEFQEILDDLSEAMPALDGELAPGLFRPGTEVPTDHELVRGLLGALESEGLPARVEGMTAWVDAAFLNEAGIPSVCFGPGSIAKAHSADESVPVEDLVRGAAVLESFTRRFLAG